MEKDRRGLWEPPDSSPNWHKNLPIKKGSLSIKNMNASGDDGTSCLSKSNVIMGMYMTKILE